MNFGNHKQTHHVTDQSWGQLKALSPTTKKNKGTTGKSAKCPKTLAKSEGRYYKPPPKSCHFPILVPKHHQGQALLKSSACFKPHPKPKTECPGPTKSDVVATWQKPPKPSLDHPKGLTKARVRKLGVRSYSSFFLGWGIN